MHTLETAPEIKNLRHRIKRELARDNLTVEQASELLADVDSLDKKIKEMYKDGKAEKRE